MTAPAPARRSKLVRLLVRGLLALVLLEASSAAAYWVLFGRPFVPARVGEQKVAIASGGVGEDAQGQLSQLFVVPHPFVGYVWDKEKVNTTPGFVSHHEGHAINEHGFMDSGPFLQKRADDRLLVGVTGGSVAWWFSGQGDEALAAGLRLAPELAGRDIRFVRLASGGYKQPQQLMILTYLLALGGELDVLINLDGFNEVVLSITDDLERGVYPYFPREWDRLVGDLPDIETKRRVGRLVHAQDARVRWASAFDGMPARYSPTLQLAWSLRDRRLRKGIAGARWDLQAYARAEQAYAVRGPGIAAFEGRDALADIAQVWRQCSIQMDRLCLANGIRYLHFLQPNQYVEGSKPMNPDERELAIDPTTSARIGVEHGYPHLLEAAAGLREAGVGFHDLRMVFQDVWDPLYIDPYCHLNRRGNELLAGRIAAEVLASFGISSEFRGFADVPARVVIDDPSLPVRLALSGIFSEGGRRPLAPAWPGLTYASSEPAIVQVTSTGELIARRLGSAVISARLGDHEVRVAVDARWSSVLEYGAERAAEPAAPRLRAAAGPPRRGDASIRLELEDVPPGSRGALVVSAAPLLEGVDATQTVPNAIVLPLPESAARDGRCSFELPIADDAELEGRPTFCRAFFVSAVPGGEPTYSNGLVLTVAEAGG